MNTHHVALSPGNAADDTIIARVIGQNEPVIDVFGGRFNERSGSRYVVYQAGDRNFPRIHYNFGQFHRCNSWRGTAIGPAFRALLIRADRTGFRLFGRVRNFSLSLGLSIHAHIKPASALIVRDMLSANRFQIGNCIQKLNHKYGIIARLPKSGIQIGNVKRIILDKDFPGFDFLAHQS